MKGRIRHTHPRAIWVVALTAVCASLTLPLDAQEPGTSGTGEPRWGGPDAVENQIYLDNVHLTLWHADEREEAAQPSGWGANVSWTTYLAVMNLIGERNGQCTAKT